MIAAEQALMHQSPELKRAYAACREIARREAKNFYYAFLALPRHKGDAMCAVYAFMRRADDLADDEAMSIEARRAAMAEWSAAWAQAQAGGPTEDPVFIALLDTQRRFGISDDLLRELVRGTAMDLDEEATARMQIATLPAMGPAGRQFAVYQTFNDLYEYCYLVASVVGLVCIRIFGYTDPRAEEFAEQTGIAFQLTNILRDVREDADRGRIYLPVEDLEKFSVTVEELALHRGKVITLNQRELLEFEAGRARDYYRASEELLPLIDADSRAALWVLVTIYRTLLDRIEDKSYDVFTRRVRVGTLTKIWILLRGVLRAVFSRIRL